MAKVCVVGAGSMSFGLAALKGLLEAPGLDAIDLFLHDIDGDAVSRMGNLGKAYVENRGLKSSVLATTDPTQALEGADVVVLSVTLDREAKWRQDRQLGLDHGINHYAENGGPGALFHTARNLAIIMPLVRSMETLCPNAWILNYTNPVPRICTAINRFSSMRAIGVCHQLDFGYFMTGVLLADQLGIDLPPDPRFRWTDNSVEEHHRISIEARTNIALLASGTNHFTWAHTITRRGDGASQRQGDGASLYDQLRAANRAFEPSFEPFTRKVFELFDIFPTPGDTHLVEFLPFTHSPQRNTWHKFDIQMYDFSWSEERRQRQAQLVEKVAAERNFSLLANIDTERVELLTEALLKGNNYIDEAVNLPNQGQVPGLLEGAIVETPGLFLPAGPSPVNCPALPAPVQELCRRQATINELSVAGTLERNRGKLLQALAIDPMIDDPDLAPQFSDLLLASLP